MEWETIIGLEIHVQLATKSKLFSGAATQFGAPPNTQACIIDLGFPGVLPVLNQQAVALACKFGYAVGADILQNSVFARKNYFYPDLPKGYQISQYEFPIVERGKILINLANNHNKTINLTRAHLEEDAGKSLHGNLQNLSGIDLNRAGVPLLEIVTEPELRSATEAVTFLKTLHTLVRYLEISDANMQEGSFRCDVNISLRPKGSKEFGTRAEIKNVNSFKFVEKAINYEIMRQQDLLESNKPVVQETRLYDPDKNATRSMRNKEEAFDYRYFPDPDLLPVYLEKEFLNNIKNNLPELPNAKKLRFQEQYKLREYDADILVQNKELAKYFESSMQENNNAKITANWIITELLGMLNKHNLTIQQSPITAKNLGILVARIEDNTISGKIAKTVFEALWRQEGSTDAIITNKNLKQVTDSSAIEKLIDTVIKNNPQQVQAYKSGKDKLFGFFVGQVMKLSKGSANPQQVNELLKKQLK